MNTSPWSFISYSCHAGRRERVQYSTSIIRPSYSKLTREWSVHCATAKRQHSLWSICSEPLVCFQRSCGVTADQLLIPLVKERKHHGICLQYQTVKLFISRLLYYAEACVNSHLVSYKQLTELVSWCFEPSQPLRVTSGLNMTSNQSLSYSARKSLNIDHNISIAQ